MTETDTLLARRAVAAAGFRIRMGMFFEISVRGNRIKAAIMGDSRREPDAWVFSSYSYCDPDFWWNHYNAVLILNSATIGVLEELVVERWGRGAYARPTWDSQWVVDLGWRQIYGESKAEVLVTALEISFREA